MRNDGFKEEYETRRGDEHEILRCLVGSQAYGTSINTPEYTSDQDFKGIYVSPENEVIGITREKETRRFSPDDHSYSLRHFARLAAKCVPNVLELLFCEAEAVVHCTKEGQLLRDNKLLFLSQNCINPYVGYAQGQLEKSAKVPTNRGIGRQEIVAKYSYDTKFAMHTIRLLQTAEELLRDGVLKVKRPNRDFLLDIRFGRAFNGYDDFKNYAQNLIEKIRKLEHNNSLPEKPDMKLINELIIGIQKSYWANYK